MAVLKIRGGLALSAFRLRKLNQQVGSRGPDLRVASACHWHFAEIARDLDPAGRATLEQLLTYGPPAPVEAIGGRAVLVTPRFGTISPWSSKATDIVRQCGLEGVRRVERGTAYHLQGGGEWRSCCRSCTTA